MTKSVLDKQMQELFSGMLDFCSALPLREPVYFYSEMPNPDESAKFGIEMTNGKPSFCFHGSWFNNKPYLKEYKRPLINPDIVIRELDKLGRYMFKDYTPKNQFLEIQNFYFNLIRRKPLRV